MIELISVHIPKAAGTSFKWVLKHHYGDHLLQLYNPYKSGIDFLKIAEKHPKALAIHGHFRFKPFREKYPNAKSIIWMRHPVERLISQYYYWRAFESQNDPKHDQFMNEDWSIHQLAEYVKDDIRDHYLGGGFRIADFDFVGVVEHMREDYNRFEEWIKTIKICSNSRFPNPNFLKRFLQWWRTRSTDNFNKTENKEPVPENVRLEIAEIMSDEIELYNDALEHRKSAKSQNRKD